MNPLDLRGPEFLAFYAVCAVAAGLLIVIRRRAAEGGELSRVTLSDPYLIAYLRGGPDEALRVATVSLVDRGLLKAEGNYLETVNPEDVKRVRRPLEQHILERFRGSSLAQSAFDDGSIRGDVDALGRDLERVGLLPDEETKRRRRGWALMAIALLWVLAFLKVMAALSRGRTNVIFLIVLALASAAPMWMLANPRRTARGDRLVEDLRTLFAHLKERATGLSSGGATAEAALLAAVFGLAALPAAQFSFAQRLFPRAESSTDGSSSTSSCSSSSSSCSSGSSCGGGGGCGGCGS